MDKDPRDYLHIMPGKKNRQRRRRQRGSRSTGSVKVPFKCYTAITLAGGLGNFPCAPTAAGINVPRLTTVSDAFQKYRFTSLKFRLLLDAGSSAADSAMAFVGKSIVNSTLNTIPEMFETGFCSFVSTKQTMHGQWVNVTKSILRGTLPWYQTQAGNSSSDAEEDNQGQFYFISSGTPTLHVEFVGVVELATPVDPSNSPLPEGAYEAARAALDARLQATRLAREKSDELKRKEIVRLLQDQKGSITVPKRYLP